MTGLATRSLACALLACIAASGPSLHARAALDADDFESLASTFQDHLDSLGRQDDAPPGMLAAFSLPDGRVGAASTGWADREAEVPMSLDTRSMSGSIGKTFVSAVALAIQCNRDREVPTQEFTLALAEIVIDSLGEGAGRRAAGSK